MSASGILTFLRVVGNLKRTKRAGWIRSGIALEEVESVSDHMYRMSIISMVITNESIATRATKMSLVHDLAEAIIGDITPHDGVSEEEKHASEKRALLSMVKTIDDKIGNEIVELWEEYENGSSEVAKLVKDIDKFEMILQADEYESKTDINLQDFFDSTTNVFKTKLVRDLVEQLYIERKRRNQLT